MTSRHLTDRRQGLGRRGEALAKRYLEQAGYDILAADYRASRRQIDLIGRRGRELVFVEVKTRALSAASREENPLRSSQIKNLKRAARDYCHGHRRAGDIVRLDLIIILADTGRGRADLRHYRDVA